MFRRAATTDRVKPLLFIFFFISIYKLYIVGAKIRKKKGATKYKLQLVFLKEVKYISFEYCLMLITSLLLYFLLVIQYISCIFVSENK